MMASILRVSLAGQAVGRLAINPQRDIVFEYDSNWLARGFDLSPGTIPFDGRANGSRRPKVFDGLPGVFNDSLPDGWGLLLMDRALKARQGLERWQITPLDRLAYIGTRGMGALEYQPEMLPDDDAGPINLADLAAQSERLLSGDTTEVIEALRIHGGSPGGVRPKVTVAFSEDRQICQSGFGELPKGFAHWIVKFRNDGPNADPPDMGRQEMAYAEMARLAGLDMPKTALIELTVKAQKEAFFAVKRFDRDHNRKIHFLSLSGYAYASHRVPCLDYSSGVLAATKKLTRSDLEVAKAFRLMVFNVLAHNKDDHAKNFAYLRDGVDGLSGPTETTGQWRLAPAFDLTFNYGINNQHTTSINGKGNPTYADLKAVATGVGLRGWAGIVEEVRAATSHWPILAKQHGVTKVAASEINTAMRAIDAGRSTQ